MQEKGRSMVEMLGVLAIIGVLSVGAMAGYSKAMMKYKLNKQAEQINNLFINALSSAPEFTPLPSSGSAVQYSLIPYYIKLNFVPENMIMSNSVESLQDVFKNTITAGYINTAAAHHSYMEMSVQFTMKNDKPSVMAQCLNLINLFKEYHEYIYEVFTQSFSNDQVNKYQRLKGDDNCDEGDVCLKSLYIGQIENFCNNCFDHETATAYCRIAVQYNRHIY